MTESLFGLDLVPLIKAAGYLGLFGIIFAESGLFVGFFLPGDSLLFTAGFLASQGFLNIWLLSFLTFAAAVLGDNVGYAFGRRVGPAIFTKEDSLFFKKSYLERTRVFYERHGGKTIVLARFLPVIRTFAPILAGAGEMPWANFFFYNLLGGALWAIGLPFLGYGLGSAFPNANRYLLPVVIAIIIVSTLPTLRHLLRAEKF